MALRLEIAEPAGALMALGEGDQVACDELRLIIGEAPDAAIGLDETHGEKVVELGVEDVEIEEGTAVGAKDEIIVEEGNGDLVAGGVHDEIGFDLASVAEADLVAGELHDFGLHPDAAMAAELRQCRAHGRVGVHDAMLGLGQTVAFVLTHHQPLPMGVEPVAQAARHRDLLAEIDDAIHWPAEHEFRHEISAAAHAEIDPLGDARRIDDDVGAGIARADHHDALVGELLYGAIVARMQDLAGERAGDLRRARHMMMAVGDDESAVEAGAFLAGDLDAPAVLRALGALDRRVELDLVENAEIEGVSAQIGERLPMRGIARIFLGEGIVLEARVFSGRDKIGGVVDDAGVGRLVPQAADVVLALQTIEGDAALAESLGGGQPGRSGADDADLVRIAFHIHVSCNLLTGVCAVPAKLTYQSYCRRVYPRRQRCGILWRSWSSHTKRFGRPRYEDSLSKESDSQGSAIYAPSGRGSGGYSRSRAVLRQLASGQNVAAENRQSLLRRHHLHAARGSRAGDVHARLKRQARDRGELRGADREAVLWPVPHGA